MRILGHFLKRKSALRTVRERALEVFEALTTLLRREFPAAVSDLNEKTDRPAVR